MVHELVNVVDLLAKQVEMVQIRATTHDDMVDLTKHYHYAMVETTVEVVVKVAKLDED